MGYFRELPDIEYQSFLSDAISSKEYLKVKNLFRRNKLRDDLQNVFTIFDKYEIVDGARPDTVAEEFYGNSELDWVVLMTANITRVRDQWPLSNRDLYKYAEKKYGKTGLLDPHHYETTEFKNNDVVMVPAGLKVESDYSINFYDAVTNSMTTARPVVSVTNYQHEEKLNNDKRNIFLLKQRYLNVIIDDFEDSMKYKKGSSQYMTETLKRADNIRLFS